MADNLKILVRLYRQYAKMDFLWLLRDTRYFLLQFVTDMVSGGCTIAGVYLLSLSFPHFCGMNREDILFMMGYSAFIDGLYMMFFIGNNTGMISRIIARGQLDHIIIQPVPIWAELLAQGFSPFSGSPMLIFGTGLTFYGISKISIFLSSGWILLFLLYAACSCMIIFSYICLLSCTAFYAPAAAEEIAMVGKDLFSSLKTYPLGSMGAGMKGIFLTAVPIGLTAWFPSLLLLQAGRQGLSALKLSEALYLPAASMILLTITMLLFKKGMKHYAAFGSPRYSGFGHR